MMRRPSIAIDPCSVGSPWVQAFRKSLTSAFWRLVTLRRRKSASFVTAIDCNHTQRGFMDKARKNSYHGGTETRRCSEIPNPAERERDPYHHRSCWGYPDVLDGHRALFSCSAGFEISEKALLRGSEASW